MSAAVDRAATMPLFSIERKLSRMLLSHVQSAWYNLPRRRRFLVWSLLEWQEFKLYDATSVMSEKDEKDRQLIDALPEVVLLWRLQVSIIRELTLPSLRLPAPRLALNFVRRYKWAFPPEYAKLRPQVAALDLSAYVSASVDVLKDEREPLRLHFERPRDGLFPVRSYLVLVSFEVARSLSAIAGELALAAPATIVGVNDFDAGPLLEGLGGGYLADCFLAFSYLDGMTEALTPLYTTELIIL
ncbi:hypothetical protein BJV78DRAFT_1151738 [Lactifluus subvellereus]|nr:hypothetical protein BJV78DRAFT_1151738 [Lactifluus subvellereus]